MRTRRRKYTFRKVAIRKVGIKAIKKKEENRGAYNEFEIK